MLRIGSTTANLPNQIVDFRGFALEHNLTIEGWDSQAHREFPGELEASNVSRDSVSRELGRTPCGGEVLHVDVSRATPDVKPCRTSPPMPVCRTCLARNA